MKEKKTKTAFTAREVGALIEDLRGKFGTVAEQLRGLQETIDANTGIVAENKQELTMHGIRLNGIEDKLTKINGKLAKIEDDIIVIKNDFGKRLTVLETLPK